MEPNSTPPRHPSEPAVAQSDKTNDETTPAGPYVGRPLDGSQYIDVVEEQEYADRRPSAEEQRPRYSRLHAVEQKGVEAPRKA